MIPYIHVPDLHLGPLTLHPFGLLVATGVIVGTALATRRARARGVDLDKLNSFITWMLVAGFIGGHVLDEIFYHPCEIVGCVDKGIKARPWSLLFLWEGLSSFGGFTGALIGIVSWKFFELSPVRTFDLGVTRVTLYKPARRAAVQPILPLADIILSVFPVAWIFGRSGCSVVHDHPGAKASADALLAVAYGHPTRIEHFGPIELRWGASPQYDLGLLELMFTVILSAFIAMTWSRRLRTGTYVVVCCMAYAPVRFVMDFFRIRDTEGADPRYGGLTPAQWACVALFAFGVYLLRYILQQKDDSMLRVLKKPASDPPPEVGEGSPAQ
jgi:phosphatidylglycerol:prolipoprotein diacylglycerol transferase